MRPKTTFRTTISISPDAQDALDWIRKHGIPFNVSRLCSKVIADGVKEVQRHLTPEDLTALSRVHAIDPFERDLSDQMELEIAELRKALSELVNAGRQTSTLMNDWAYRAAWKRGLALLDLYKASEKKTEKGGE